MTSLYRNTVFGSCHEALKNCLLSSTDLLSMKSSDGTDSPFSSGSTAYHVSYRGCYIVTEGSFVENQVQAVIPYEYTECININRENRKTKANLIKYLTDIII